MIGLVIVFGQEHVHPILHEHRDFDAVGLPHGDSPSLWLQLRARAGIRSRRDVLRPIRFQNERGKPVPLKLAKLVPRKDVDSVEASGTHVAGQVQAACTFDVPDRIRHIRDQLGGTVTRLGRDGDALQSSFFAQKRLEFFRIDVVPVNEEYIVTAATHVERLAWTWISPSDIA